MNVKVIKQEKHIIHHVQLLHSIIQKPKFHVLELWQFTVLWKNWGNYKLLKETLNDLQKKKKKST